MREEIEALVNSRVEKILDRLNLVSREEFDVVKAMLSKSRTEQEKLEERLRKLESQKKFTEIQKQNYKKIIEDVNRSEFINNF